MQKDSDSSSDLFDLKNYFIIGNYQGAINEGTSLSSTSFNKDSDRIDRDAYLYRSYIAQGKHNFVLSEISDSSNTPAPLQAVKLLATFLANPNGRETVVNKLKAMISEGASSNATVQLVGATIYYHLGNYEEALRCVYQSNSLEGMAFLIQIYLKINRLDLAEKELRSMQKIDEDASVTLLATAWVSIAIGSASGNYDKVSEASQIFQDLIEKYTSTTTLLNGLAVCNMHMKKFENAEKLLLQALEKNASDTDSLVNLIACYQHEGKPQEIITRYINQLKVTTNGNHWWLNSQQKVQDEFQRVVKQFAP